MTINPFYYSIGTRVRDRAFLEMLKPSKEDRILDVGCGLGYFTDLLSKDGAECYGIDLDEKCIDYCQKYMKGQYQVADVTKIPFPDNYFDKILCTEVLEHIDHNEEILKEIRRVLKKDGILVTSVPCSEGMFKAFFKRIGHNSVDSNSREYHWHKGYTKEQMALFLKQHKFQPQRNYYTLVAAIEAIMGLSKIVVQLLQAKKIDSQANALIVKRTSLWRIYVKLFPILMIIARTEQPLSKWLRGHMLITESRCRK